jgi:rod shape-determining protein MreC
MPPAARSFSRRDTVLLALCLLMSVVALTLPDRLRDPIASTLRRTIVAPLVALQRDAELTRRAWLARDEEIAVRDSIVMRSMTLAAVESENDRLRGLLGLGQRLGWGFAAAEVLHGGGGGEQHHVTLTAGERAGVRAFSPVVSAEGVVGMVRTVDPSLSIAILWAHPDFRISAMSVDGGAYGIVQPYQGGEERHLLEMRGVPLRSTLAPGAVIVSSGLGGVFPRGIPVGTVVSELRSNEVWARSYVLRPSVMPADIRSVMILLPQRAAAGVDGVWQTGAGVDSAARSIVRAGDSLSRAAAARGALEAAATGGLVSLEQPPAVPANPAGAPP